MRKNHKHTRWRPAGPDRLRERSVITVLTAGFLILVAALFRQSDVSGMNPREYWNAKLNWQANADVIIAGDSRVNNAVSPAAMKKILPGRHILNYAFSAVGYSADYFDAIERVLNPASPHKTIILGISPRSLTPSSLEKNGFFELKATKKSNRTLQTISQWLYYVEPLSDKDLNLIPLARHPEYKYLVCYHPDGWEATEQIPPHPVAPLEEYQRFFHQNRVTEQIIDQLLTRIKKWSDNGVRVYCFRPPTTAPVVVVEDNVSGFDVDNFKAQVARCGGVWIDLDQSAYQTYDGSHLQYNSARQFSLDLAEKIAYHENIKR